jgi:hypothetical protein
MKKLIFLFLSALLFSTSFAQSNKWSSVSYSYSKGPVSPEYQLNYTININNDGTGLLTYTKPTSSDEYEFKVGKKGLKKLNYSLKNSKIFVVDPDEMKSDQNLIGGSSRGVSVTMWQEPNLDQKPTVIQTPSGINDTYREEMFSLYDTIENLVPSSVWKKAKGE